MCKECHERVADEWESPFSDVGEDEAGHSSAAFGPRRDLGAFPALPWAATESEAASVDEADVDREWEAEEHEGPPSGSARVRILWPALGFPAVIAPRTGAARTAGASDAARCITLLVLSNKPTLTPQEVSQHLRCVPWEQRAKRHIAPGGPESFKASEISVRADTRSSPIALSSAKDRLTSLVGFGGGAGMRSAIVAGMAKAVREFYSKLPQDVRLPYLHEIRVSEEASARLDREQYHLFWNNAKQGDAAPSDEMMLLLDHFAHPRRERKYTDLYEKLGKYLMEEYEFEYGPLHAPYQNTLQMRKPRAEILHPVFVRKPATKPIAIGHLTDTHVDVRADVYGKNLEEAMKRPAIKAKYAGRWKADSYNNLNRSFRENYTKAKDEADIILLTGDLIDYGRGHWGLSARDRLGENYAYHEDRNWFLFYYLLAGADAYVKPTYTILGNHDWRINPYPPFAVAGAPSPESIINNYGDFKPAERRELLQLAHGPGHERGFSYETTAVDELDLIRKNPDQAIATIVKLFGNTKRLNVKGAPTETTIESVIWYLLTINPFLDYAFPLPSGQSVLMLDWAEAEDLFFDIVEKGKARPYLPHEAKKASDVGPKAGDCLSGVQQQLVKQFLGRAGRAKIVGIHAPPISPYYEWFDDELQVSRKTFDGKGTARGPDIVGVLKDGTKKRWNGHPLFAIRPPNGFHGMEADYNSLVKAREQFIKTLIDPRSGVRLVFAGHIHRDGVLVVWRMGSEKGQQAAGALRVRGIAAPVGKVAPGAVLGPLFVNTTSAGFRGNYKPRAGQGATVPPGRALATLGADGVVERVEFRALQESGGRRAANANALAPQREVELPVG